MDILALAATGLYKSMKKNKDTEKFTTDSDGTSVGGTVLFVFLILFLCLPYIIIWIRSTYIAFKCSTGDGICALLFFGMWSMWKFGTLVDSYCTKSSTIM